MEDNEEDINQSANTKNKPSQSYKECKTYSCIYCQSPIEIFSINLTNISFKCIKNKTHLIKEISINEYLNKMILNTYINFSCKECGKSQTEQNNEIFKYCINCKKILCNDCIKKHDDSENHNIIETSDINYQCLKHYTNEIVCFCFNCNAHLCEICLSSMEHIQHKKIYFSEIKPDDEKKIIKKMISKYKNERKQLKQEQKDTQSKLEEDSNNQLTELKDNFKKTKKEIKKKSKENKSNEENNQNMEDESQEDNENYASKISINADDQIEKIKRKYENDTKTLELKLKEDIEKNEKIFLEKINLINDFININEVIYNSYDSFALNYHNCINVIFLALYYCNNESVYLKEKLKEKYESTVSKITQKYKKINEIKLNEEKIIKDLLSFNIQINNNIKNSINTNEIILNLFKEKLNINAEKPGELVLSNKYLGEVILYYLSYMDINKYISLWLDGNNISNIKPLTSQNCSKLKKITLSNNGISDISPLENFQCNNLEELYLYSNKIFDINVLSKINVPNLKILSLSDNNICDISCLANAKIKNIERIDFSKNNISDINVLKKLKFQKLKVLCLSSNRINDLSVFPEISLDLRQLDLSKNDISNLDILIEKRYKFEKFQLLYLSGNNIDNNKYKNYIQELKNIKYFKI